ncbi:MAG: hypothetical protein JST68_10690 [Bacteroidetes bacterium]|nr:hypothetical protein [Bacteroidota bacterium]
MMQRFEERMQISFVKKLLVNTDFSVEKIADLADVTVEFVEEVRADED